MKKISILLCGISIACVLTGCGKKMPELTEEENQMIAEYAAGMLLKYDKGYNNRLVDTSAYEVTEEDISEQTEEMAEEEQTKAEPVEETEVIDVSQDEETVFSTIEAYYGIQDVTFQYTGYELTDSYPSAAEGEDLFFAMDATEGTELLVLKFTAINTSNSDVALNMIEHGARFRVSVNGEAGKGALATMLLDDLQTYDDVISAGSSVELVSIVEIPQGTNINSIEFILRGNGEDTIITLE